MQNEAGSARRRALLVACGAVFAAAFLALSGSPEALAKSKKKKLTHLRYMPTYAEAVNLARARNAILFAAFHKDN